MADEDESFEVSAGSEQAELAEAEEEISLELPEEELDLEGLAEAELPLEAEEPSDAEEESMETNYSDTTYTSGYYFTRFYNSIDNTHSDYSDAIPYGGFADNTVGYVIDLAMRD